MRLPLSFETSLTRADFLRLLPAAVGGDQFVEAGSIFSHQETPRSWQIRFEPLPELKLGPVRMARHQLTFTFDGYAETEIECFMTRFELYFRRGGG